MALLQPDPTFYPSPRLAGEAPAERLGYVGVLNPGNGKPDGMAVVDMDPQSSTYSTVVSTLDFPNTNDEVHHFGWNACSSALCPYSPHPHLERRYLIVPTLKTSRIYVIDTKPDAYRPTLVKTIEPEVLQLMRHYPWPGNVRELQNICERADLVRLCANALKMIPICKPGFAALLWTIEYVEKLAVSSICENKEDYPADRSRKQQLEKPCLVTHWT